jgi:hypothetical protein
LQEHLLEQVRLSRNHGRAKAGGDMIAGISMTCYLKASVEELAVSTASRRKDFGRAEMIQTFHPGRGAGSARM